MTSRMWCFQLLCLVMINRSLNNIRRAIGKRYLSISRSSINISTENYSLDRPSFQGNWCRTLGGTISRSVSPHCALPRKSTKSQTSLRSFFPPIKTPQEGPRLGLSSRRRKSTSCVDRSIIRSRQTGRRIIGAL
jgi:hypothetical protein